MPVYSLSEKNVFPPPHLSRKDGLLAVGGDLTKERLVLAYAMGIFPWFSDDAPIMWWSPDPRLVLYPDEIRVSKSLKKIIRQNRFHVTMDTAFERVITACSKVKRRHEKGTWIVGEMIKAYIKLHEAGFAHSVEAWLDGELAGGLYGVSLGRTFFGESMFTYKDNASKAAFVKLAGYLAGLSFDLIDCQVTTDHLLRCGAKEILRNNFRRQLEKSLGYRTRRGKWEFV